MNKSKKLFLFFLTLTLLIVIGAYLSVIPRTQNRKINSSFPTPIPTPETPSPSLSQRSSTFSIFQNTSPRFLEITFDPFEARGGEEQTLLCVASEIEGKISKVFAKVEDGIGQREIQFSLLKRENDKSLWQATWEIKLTKEKSYPITFFLENEKGEQNQITLFWDGKEGGSLKE